MQRSLTYALWESGDDVVADLYIQCVEPYPNASRMMVFVHHEHASREEIIERLERLRPVLRAAVAESIHRKKTPELVFELAAFAPA